MEFDCPTNDLYLEEVREDQFGDVVEAMKQYLPHSIHVQSSVSVTKHYDLAAVLGRKVFTPRHPDYRYKMVVVTPVTTKKRLQSLQVFWSSPELPEDAVYRLLKTLPDFSWCEPFLVRLLPEHLHQQLSRVVSTLSAGRVCPQESTALWAHLFEGPVPEPPSLGPDYMMGRVRRPDYSRVLANMMLSAYEDTTAMETVFDRLPRIGIYKVPQVQEEPQQTAVFIPGKLDEPGWKTDAVTLVDGETRPDAHEAEGHRGMITCNKSQRNGDSQETLDEEHRGMTLVSWCTVKPAGDVGTTFTEEEHRGKKLARTAMLAAMKQAEAMGTFPYSNCGTDNDASRTMLQSMGIQNKFVTYVIIYSDRVDD